MYNNQMFTYGTLVGNMVVIFSAAVTTSNDLDNNEVSNLNINYLFVFVSHVTHQK